MKNAFWIVGPVVLLFKLKVFKRNFNDALVFKVSREETKKLILAFASYSVGTKGDSCREDMTPVIVCVLTNQIDPTW
jgi:hypothetical protein